MKERSPTLLALTASALAALGPARAQDATPGAGPQVDYRYSAYREGDMPASKDSGGQSSPRYEIDTHQFRLTQPVDDETSLTADLAVETMSGASPWYVQPDASGKPVQVMSGASIKDQRTDLLLGVSRRRGKLAASLGAGYSEEDDYRAANLSLSGEYSLDDTVTTLSGGIGYSDDKMTPTQGATAVSVTEATRKATTVYAGCARVLDAATVIQASLSYTLHDGFLADPYKAAYVATAINPIVADARPDRRGQVAWLARLRRFFKGADAALHADYRYYHDDWETDAHTVDLAWHQKLGSVRLVPGVRWYSQSQTYFYEPYYNDARSDGLASSDYRLSPYGALSLNLTAAVEVGGWGASLRYENYDSDIGYALGNVAVENPGLVDFNIVSLGLKRTF